MEEALSFVRTFEIWIYLVLGLGGLFYIWKFVASWQELRVAAFGLERESAQSRLNQATIMLVLILCVAIVIFVLVTFVAPSMPEANPLPTATIDLLATPTITLLAEASQTLAPDTTPSPVQIPTAGESACIPDQIMITSPANDAIISGVVEITGTADIPNFGFYKLEMKRPDESVWATIQAGNEIRVESKLGDWDTRLLTPGIYQLGLVLVDNEAKASQPCVVQVSVTTPPPQTPNP